MKSFLHKIRLKFNPNDATAEQAGQPGPPSGRPAGRHGRFFRSLRYLIREEFLIVVGILVALQLNKWYDQREILRAEQVFLKDLKEEIILNKQNLENCLELNKKALKDALIIGGFYKNPEKLKEISSDSIFKLTWNLAGVKFEPDYSILNSFISSGQIGSIRNKELRYTLSSLSNKTTRLIRYSNLIRLSGRDLMDKNIYPKFGRVILNGKTTRLDFKGLFQIPEFGIAIEGIFINRRKESLARAQLLVELYEETLILIQSEIE